MGKRLTKEDFINRSIGVHGNKYDYSNVVYKNMDTNVEILCPIHGAFLQLPHSHLMGCGCKDCSYEKRGIGIPHKKKRKHVCGVGINDMDISCGEVSDSSISRIYGIWHSMIGRCYSKNNKNRVSYIGCSVCEEWLYFSNFYIWYKENYIEGYALDKDILFKGNKLYSPNTCCFVPQYINSLLVCGKSRRGSYPIGVSKKGKYFRATIRKDGLYVHLGTFKTEQEAFLAYKSAKESYIRDVAKDYYSNGRISENVYKALLNYNVEKGD